MKKNIKVYSDGNYVDKQINYIPFRYIMAILITLLEVVAIIAVVALMAVYIPYFYIALILTQFVSIVLIVVSSGTPDYKLTWLFFVVVLPLIGLMLFFIFHKRRLPKKYIKRLNNLHDSYEYDDKANYNTINDELIISQAKSLCFTSGSHLYKNTAIEYYSLGEDLHKAMLAELKKAKKFIFLEYFIIEQGAFWDSLLEVLIEKAKVGVEVKLVYDDVGCMSTLPGDYYKKLYKKYKIQTVLFSKLKGQADAEFNNRSHRKILVVDGQVGFTGGVNIADEYINQNDRLGHWKDTGVKIEGKAVNELTKLFLTDFYLNAKKFAAINFNKYYIAKKTVDKNNFVIPFGDGPKPIYEHSVGKLAIMNMLNQARKYVYITTPYLIVDDEMFQALKNTAMRCVDIKIIVPHIPDKKLVFGMTKNTYRQLIKWGVKVYEYTPGFIHAKSYVADDNLAIIGTINLDYRSLSHHFENGIWIYNDKAVFDMKQDFINTLNVSEYMNEKTFKDGIFSKFVNVLVKIFAPLL